MAGFKHFFVEAPTVGQRLRVRGIGIRETMRPTLVHRPQGSPDHLLMLFHDPVQLWQAGGMGDHPPRSLIIWPPGARQHYGNPRRRWRHSWLHCAGQLPQQLLRQLKLPTARAVGIAAEGEVERGLRDLHDEIALRSRPDPAILLLLCEALFRRCARAMQTDPPAIPESFLELRRRLDQEPERRWTLADMARIVALSPPRLSAVFKQHFRVAPKEYLIRQRLLRADELLRDVERSIGSIAASVGYEDIYHFSKLYKKHYGRSPSESRKAMTGAA